MSVDSGSWTCQNCGAPMIGGRAADDICMPCVIMAITTDPPA